MFQEKGKSPNYSDRPVYRAACTMIHVSIVMRQLVNHKVMEIPNRLGQK